jgi:hypothetical protein
MPGTSYLTVWHRGPLAEASGHPAAAPASTPAAADDPAVATLALPHLRGQPLTVRILYPSGAGAGIRWDARAGALSVSLPRTPSACVLSLVHLRQAASLS